MAKFELPDPVFDKEIVSGSADKAVKDAEAKAPGQTAGKLFMVPVENVRVIDGYNVRIRTADYEKHERNIADSIKANGFDPAKPLAAYAGKEGDAHVVYVTDGHTRLAATKIANNEGAEISTLPVVIKPQTTNREDLTVALLQSNEGRPLKFWERAVVVKRLVGYGMDKMEIAKRLGMSDRMIDNYIILSGAPAKIRDMVISEQVAATEAMNALKKNPETAVAVLQAAVAAAKASGKTKATAKDVEGAREGGSGEGAAASGGTRESSTTTTKTVKGKTVRKDKLTYKAGDETDAENIREVQKFEGGTWWSVLPGSDKKRVKINSDITIEFTVTTPAPEPEPDAGTGEGPGEAPETPATEDPEEKL